MSKVNPPGGVPTAADFPVSRSSPTSANPKNSFNNVLTNTGQKETVKPNNKQTAPATYSGGNDVMYTLTALVQKGAPASQIVRTALQNNPVYQLLSPERQNDMVKQLAQKVKEDPTLKIG